jgi:hypothetical protein
MMTHFIARREMPQIDEADETALVEWLAWKKVEVTEVVLNPNQLHFHQRVNMNRVRSMPQWVYDKPAWVSEDGYVLDGNHRAHAHKLHGDPMNCLRIDLPFEQAVEVLFSFAGTYTYAQRQHAAAY